MNERVESVDYVTHQCVANDIDGNDIDGLAVFTVAF
jgi:hypothetical protein